VSHHWVRRIAVAVGALLVLAGGLTATTASADQSAVQVTVAYDKTTYRSNDTFTVTLTVTNNSDVDLVNLQAFDQIQNPCLAGVFDWPKLGIVFTVPAHGSVSDTETGGNPINAGLGGTATCSGIVTGQGLNIPYSTTAAVTQVYGDFNGVLFRDRNHDGTFEAGEGVNGITVQFSLSGDFNGSTKTVTSGPDGQFALSHVPVGQYFLAFSSRRNWVVNAPNVGFNEGSITVTEAAQPTLSLPVVPPLSDRLKVKFGFDQTTYQPGDTTHLTATLTNTSNKAITGVIADCNRVGDDFGLFSFDGWGALSGSGPGATIPARSTVTFHIDQPLPDPAQANGYVEAPCVFGPEPDGNPQVGFPGNNATARVPGLISATVLQFVRSDNTTIPVAGLKVRIVDELAKQVVTTATTDGNGEISLPTLPAGLYTLHLLGGFTIPAGQSNFLPARSPGSLTNPRSYEVTPPAN
jgi:SdrD B-like domain